MLFSNIQQDIINKLTLLIGINTNVLKELFMQYGIERFRKDRDGFTEDVIALLLNKARPSSKKGADFQGLFEVKQISCNIINSGDLRVKGDTPIANLEDREFFASNCWDKTRTILCVLVVNHCPNCNSTSAVKVPFQKKYKCSCGEVFTDTTAKCVITDIRLFDGEKYKETMKKDWDLIQKGFRAKTEMFSLKEKWNNQIQIKKNGCIKLSTSLTKGTNNNITDQETYCADLFEEDLARREEEFRRKIKTIVDRIASLLDGRLSINDLDQVIAICDSKKEDALGFKDIKDNLTF